MTEAEEAGIISERSDPAVQRIIDVARSSKPRPRTVMIEDAEPLLTAIAADVRIVELYASASLGFPPELKQIGQERGIPMRLIEATVLNEIFKGDRKARVFGIARVPRPCSLHDAMNGPGDVVILDGVRVAGNIGAIVRTCTALGASALLLADSELTSIADRRLIRASRAHVFSLPVVLSDREQLSAALREAGLPVLVFDSGGDLSVHEIGGIRERCALVFGSEKRGPSDEITALAKARGARVSIPMRPAAESLNVSVAVGIGLTGRSARNQG